MYNDMTSRTISNAYMMFEMSVNEYVMMSSNQCSSLSDTTNLINDEQHEKDIYTVSKNAPT